VSKRNIQQRNSTGHLLCGHIDGHGKQQDGEGRQEAADEQEFRAEQNQYKNFDKKEGQQAKPSEPIFGRN